MIVVQIVAGLAVMDTVPGLIHDLDIMPDTRGWPVLMQPLIGIGIHAVPAAIGTTAAGMLMYALLGMPRLRRMLLQNTLRCQNCGYSREGLAADTCPECGETLTHGPDRT
ncbi:MAG: hypothetical protein AAGB48_07445 [Planctomycetota bacterium]